MKKKSIIGLTLVVALVVTASAAFADGRGYGPRGGYGMMGPGMGYGYGPGAGMMGPGTGYGPGAMWGANGAFDEETSKIFQKLYEKRAELNQVLSAPQVDGRKAKSLQVEINRLQNQLSEKRLAADLEFRKNNPGASSGWGAGYGPGACWR